ncbi:hypothetical protein [Tepidibacter formicigenes]|jgi:uncharacterized membrane protein (DUF485 family)|uniref:Alpha-glucosidase n=1 Tax=Tepidibacter formicigenes DSM 15518 TaxID=1123349 RepID=A0A1M6JNV8_9FIRM|nr:hypothetical protein [Tepidibacter formicigenes]SHJ48336.1 hypothetical protein SAMN02744037_00154 [Tepidibacter formicigenes DSM 15518]
MKALTLINTLKQLSDLVKSLKNINKSKREKYLNQISSISNQYEKLDVPTDLSNIYDSLCNKGKNLIKELKEDRNSKENTHKIEVYIRYLKAAKGDFEGSSNYVNKYYRSFIFTTILFLALSPQYFGFILPAVFFIPIFLGIKGVKNRSINGLYMSLSVVPVALMTSFIWIRYGIYAFSNYQIAISKVIQDTGRSISVAKALVTIPPILALILLTLALVQGYRGYKSKDLFV